MSQYHADQWHTEWRFRDDKGIIPSHAARTMIPRRQTIIKAALHTVLIHLRDNLTHRSVPRCTLRHLPDDLHASLCLALHRKPPRLRHHPIRDNKRAAPLWQRALFCVALNIKMHPLRQSSIILCCVEHKDASATTTEHYFVLCCT